LDVVARALEIEPEQRIVSASALRKALQSSLQVHAMQAPARKRLARSLASAIALGVIGLSLAAVGIKPAIRERAHAALGPIVTKLAELRARAVERRQHALESGLAAESAALAAPQAEALAAP